MIPDSGKYFGLIAVCLLAAIPAGAQQYTITTIAGGSPIPTPVPALNMSIGVQRGTGGPAVAVDGTGTIYFTSYNCVFKVDVSGTATRVAGTSRRAFSGDGGPAVGAALNDPRGLAFDRKGNLFIADHGNRRIRKIAPNGVISTIAGTGIDGYSGDGGPATSGQIGYVEKLAVDNADNLYFVDSAYAGPNHRVRKISADGKISTVAGTGVAGFSGDGGPAAGAQLSSPADVAVDGAGNLYVADYTNHRVRKVSASGTITTVAGGGTPGFAGVPGTIANSQPDDPSAVAVDAAGNLFFSDLHNQRIRKVSPSGAISSVATGTDVGHSHSLAADSGGNLFYTDEQSNRIRKVSPAGIVTVVAGDGTTFGYSSEGGPAVFAQIFPTSVALDSAGNLYIGSADRARVWKVNSARIITAFAGDGQIAFPGLPGSNSSARDDGPVAQARLTAPWLTVDPDDRLIIGDTLSGRVRRVERDGTIHTVAGIGTLARPSNNLPAIQDGGQATSVQLVNPLSVAADRSGNIYVASMNSIRKVSTDGTMSTIANGGLGGYGGDGGPAMKAQFRPYGIAVDTMGNIFFTDSVSSTIRKINRAGIISTIAGIGSTDGSSRGFSGDGGRATAARLSGPHAVAVDAQGNLYISDRNNHRVRKVTLQGIISTIAGTGVEGYKGDGGPGIQAQLAYPEGIAVDTAGNVYVADTMNNAVRMLQPVR
jgi:sugar lactone lactonase YvrE